MVTAMFRPLRPFCSLCLLPLFLLLFGCSTQSISPHFAIPAGKQAALVHGGPQPPVTGSSIQLYAVGTTGDGSAATPLLSPPATTDANGSFNITGTYTCPSPSTLVYLVGTGGDPGLTPPANNAAISMMAALGPCGNLTPSTYIFVDEPTTVAAAYALAPFLSSPSAIGSAPEDATALADAFTLADELANTTTGTSPGVGVPPGVTVPVAQINTIADIISTCINSAGGVAGDGSACGTLFSLTTPPGLTPATDTITALLHLADNPTLNTAALYGIASGDLLFQPIQPQAPPDLSVNLTASSSSGFTVSPSTLNFPSTRNFTTSAPLIVTLTNNTANPVAIDIAPSFSGANPNDFATEGGCATPVMPGTSCSLEFTFRPSATGTRSAYLTLINTSANPEIPILLTGTGLEASGGAATLIQPVLSFSNAGFPSTATLANYGPGTLTIDGFTISNDPTSGQPAFTQTNNCGATLAPQASCTVTVVALATTQAYSTGLLTIADDSVSGLQTALLTYSNGNLLVNFAARSIGTQGGTTLTIQPPGIPNGTYTATLVGPDATDFSFSSGSSSLSTTCNNLSRGMPSCLSLIYFTPSALGLRSAEVDLNGVFYGMVTGVGLQPGAQLLVIPSSVFSFGSVVIGQTSTNTAIQMASEGTVPWNGPVLTGPDAADFKIVSTTCNVAPWTSCTVTVTASPTQTGNRFASLTVTDSTGAVQQTISLNAVGISPP